MKTAILTHPPAKNYGGIMQALALAGVLKELGNECQIIYGPVKKLSPLQEFKETVRKAVGLGIVKVAQSCIQSMEFSRPEYWSG